jgi:DNA-formamidopyrimidine glycosylase
MPEGPEVKRISVQLNGLLAGKIISNLEFLSGRYITHGIPKGTDSFQSVNNKKIKSINCKGKFIWFEFENYPEISIWNTLGMTGSWSREQGQHARMKISFMDESSIFFSDIRNFGTINFSFSKNELLKKLGSIGPDMLSSPPTKEEFTRIVKKQKDKTLPEFMMNQKMISGVGNYVKAEALYLAGISPLRTCSSLSEKEITALQDSIDKVLSASYNSGGSTIKTYRDVYGNVGTFKSRFLVYGNAVDPQGNKIQKLETKDGRTTFWVPDLQK